MSTLETAKRRLESALAHLETGLAAVEGESESRVVRAGGRESDARIHKELAALKAEQERLAADLAKSDADRETQKEINRSVVEALDIAIGRLDTILAE
ncbi:MAG TPA: DUF4164 family protein [Alphaproteobacteria bacterium]|jgi:hypothetical protein|nr:DUF4164 family protein [Alphaproteobacteria bacterium]